MQHVCMLSWPARWSSSCILWTSRAVPCSSRAVSWAGYFLTECIANKFSQLLSLWNPVRGNCIMMSRTDKFRLGRYFRNVESVSWDLQLLSIHGKNFFYLFWPCVLESDIVIDSVHIETFIFPSSSLHKSEVISSGPCMTYENLTDPWIEKCL